jgi:hypothetical protein
MSLFPKIHLNPWREIAILMIILMEVSWITPWFRSLTPETYAVSAIRVLVMLAVVILFSHILIRFIDYLRLKKIVRQALMVIFLIIGCYVGIKTMLYAYESVSLTELLSRPLRSFSDIRYLIPVEFIIIVTVLIGFWRGVTLAQEHIGPSVVTSHFWIGIAMLIIFVLFNTIVTGEKPGDFFFLFLFSSLVGISAARMSVIGMIRGGKEVGFERYWFLGILLAAFSVAGISLVLGILVGGQFLGIGTIVLGLIGSIFVLIWIILNPVLTFLVTIIGNLFKDSQIISDLGNTLQKLNDMMNGLSHNLMNLVSNSGIGSLFSRLAPIIKTIILTGVIIIIIMGIIFWMAFKLWKDRERGLVGSEEKSSLSSGNLLQSFLDLFRRGWNQTLNSFGQFVNFRHRQRMRAAARIRQIYTEILELCESLDQPRPDALTPLEFEPKIERMFPECQVEVSTITQAYLRVRYGLLPETQNEVSDVEAAWKRIHSAGQELLQKQKQKYYKK